MRNVRRAAVCAVALAVLGGQFSGWAQKKPLDHDVYDSWQSVSGVSKSDDGRVLVWNVNPQEGDGTLYVRANGSELAVPRGYMPRLDPKGNWVVCRIKPEFAKTRQERIDKKRREDQSKDTLAVIDITSMIVKKFPNIDSFAVGTTGMPFIAYKSTWKEAPKKPAPKAVEKPGTTAEAKPGTATEAKAPATPARPAPGARPGAGAAKSGLILLTPGTWKADTLKNIDKFVFSNDGSLLALTSKKDKKDSLSATAIILASYAPVGSALAKKGKKVAPVEVKLALDTLQKGAQEYFSPAFDDAQKQIAFLATADSNKTGSKRCAMFLAGSQPGGKWASKELIPQGTVVKGTNGWTLTETSDLYFTPDGQRIMTGIAPIRPPKDTTIVDFETAQLDIWNWDAPYTPPQQKKRIDATLRKTYPAVINLSQSSNIIPLTTSEFDNVRLIAGGKTGLALSRDNSEYVVESMWSDGSLGDFALVNINDGSRKSIAKGFNVSRFDVSPEGKYLIWFDPTDRNWYTYNIATEAKANRSYHRPLRRLEVLS